MFYNPVSTEVKILIILYPGNENCDDIFIGLPLQNYI